MFARVGIFSFLIFGFLGFIVCALLHADEGTDFFEAKIRPVLVKECYQCHSMQAEAKGKLKGGLFLDTREAIRRGGESGPAVVPGNEKKSLLLSAIRHDEFEMPPKGMLPKNVIADFTKWIKMGAPDPRDGKGIVQNKIDLQKGREFWCFQPLASTAPPEVKNDEWSKTTVDRFLFAAMQTKGVTPVGDAPSEQLVRRVFFDLTGLPPSVEQLETWSKRLEPSNNSRRQALAELIDTLLDSPQFGERWGRHWLDVARYAESNGNSRNATFPHAWRYRDYVINAFNNDMPYDAFIKQQIAGDLLPHESADERNRNLVATGFLALGSKPVIKKGRGGFVPDVVADQIEVTSRAVLGLTVACARCHDHKFDPIPTTDYYGLAGIFASSETLYGGGSGNMGGAPATPLHELVVNDPAKQKAYNDWKQQVAELTARQRQQSTELKKLRSKDKRKKGEPTKLTAGEQKRLAELTLTTKQLSSELKKLRAAPVEPPGAAMGIREGAKVAEVPVHIRGESPKGDAISRRFISVAVADSSPKLPGDQSGRLELAQWLTSNANPLTARVMVNRIWLHLFGEGIVRTPDNFGVNGERPTHPELLDFLASEFQNNGWSTKQMIRQLMLTKAYQLSDEFDDTNYEIDPQNITHWRHARRRLQAEAIRDAMLAASGQLDLTQPQGSIVTRHNGRLIQDALTPDKIHEPSNHRSIYLAMLRNGLPESLEVFDMADPSLVVGKRNVTIVPSQDLYLMNSPFVVQQSQHFADRVVKEASAPKDRIELAYRLALSRSPSPDDTRMAIDFIEQAQRNFEPKKNGATAEQYAWSGFCQALFVSAEFRNLR